MRLPTVLNFDGPVVIFGCGNVGIRKVEYVLKFTDNVLVVSKEAGELPEQVKLTKVTIDPENFTEYIPDDTSLVISALSDTQLNRVISSWCMNKNILVNVVDDTDRSTVLFPAISNSGELNIAVSTSGKCPYFARKVREELDENIGYWGIWLELLAEIRTKLVGSEKKDEILSKIYYDNEIKELIMEGDLVNARKKAEVVYNVHIEL